MTTQPPLVIIDYGLGNLRSVQKKFAQAGGNICISSDKKVIASAQKLVLPGVGHFATGVKNLRQLGLWDILHHKALIEKTPILGICLGMQLMARHGEEGNIPGLGWFDANVVRFSIEDRLTHKVPHIGWNTTEQTRASSLFAGVPVEAQFYFVHAYHLACRNPADVLATTTYESAFASVIQKENIVGVQFHPEKSHDWGQRLIENFIAH